jgi:hypothetical protein
MENSMRGETGLESWNPERKLELMGERKMDVEGMS